MGASYANKLHQGGHQVTLCDAWEQNVNMINQQGLTVDVGEESTTSKLPAYLPEHVPDADYDLILLFTKAQGLDAMVAKLQHLVKDHTKVLCALNGLGHLTTLRKYMADKNILLAVSLVGAKSLWAVDL